MNGLITDPEYADPHFELGAIKREQHAAQEAIAEFSAYLQLAPRGERARQAEVFPKALQHPSWLEKIGTVDARFFE